MPNISQCARVLRLAMLAMVWAIAACGQVSQGETGAVAARVNGVIITEADLNAAEPQQPDGASAIAPEMSNVTLEGLIQEQLLIQRARQSKLDRDPQVLQAIQSARRAALASEWLRHAVPTAAAPTNEAIRRYFDEHPESFAARRIFTFRQVAVRVPPDQLPTLQDHLVRGSDFDQALSYLQANGLSYVLNEETKGSEQISADMLPRFTELKPGDFTVCPVQDGIDLVKLIAVRAEPLNVAQAAPLISNIIKERLLSERADAAIKSLRAAAKIELVGNQKTPLESPIIGKPDARDLNEGIATGLK